MYLARAGGRFLEGTPGEIGNYTEWVKAVKAAGGSVVAMPGVVSPPAGWNPFRPSTWFGGGRADETVPAARYPMAVWVPKVNAREWDQPDAYSANGQFAYYRATDEVIAQAHTLADATVAEAAAGASSLLPDWFKNGSDAVRYATVGLTALVALEVLRALPRQR
jgi:hypothetical protein